LIPCPMMMTTSTQKLYEIRDTLIAQGVNPDTAEMYARMYPFFMGYEGGVSIKQVARFLDRSGKQVRRQMHELEAKGFLDRLHYRAWGITEQTKEQLNGKT
jgi:Mn-dependent DtxR family transcriptional regulator